MVAQTLAASLGFLPLHALSQQADALASLGAVLDCLLPADDLSPAATALGVDREMRDFLAEQELLAQVIAAGLQWLDAEAGRPFRDLPYMQQAALLSRAAASGPDQVPARCHHILRALAVEFYYARPEAIAGLPLHPAPQPLGYPPPWR